MSSIRASVDIKSLLLDFSSFSQRTGISECADVWDLADLKRKNLMNEDCVGRAEVAALASELCKSCKVLHSSIQARKFNH